MFREQVWCRLDEGPTQICSGNKFGLDLMKDPPRFVDSMEDPTKFVPGTILLSKVEIICIK